VSVRELSIEEQADAARSFASGLVASFGAAATVDATIDDDVIEVAIDGDGLGLLVGPRGATLAAVEELVRAVVAHATGGQSARVHVDVGGYRHRRREALAAFAVSIGREVLESGSSRALEPMNAADRKVVHDAIAEIDGLATGSDGEEPRRRVVIRPAP